MADHHHLEELEEEAALFALGALESDEAARFRQRVAAGCPTCCALLEQCEGTVAALPLLAPEIAPPARLRMKLLASIGAPEIPAPQKALEGSIVRTGDTEWEQGPMAGVEYRRLHGRRTMLVRMAPHSTLPEHEHAAAEQCLVLEGSVRSQGEVVHAGDFTYMPKGSKHQPLYTDTGCLLLIAYT